MYYYRMINLHHGHPWKTKQKAHTYLLNTGQTTAWIRENPQQETMRETITYGTIILPKHKTLDKHQRERTKMKYQTNNNELYQTNNINIVKTMLT